MFNRHHEDQREQNNYQSVTVNLSGRSQQSAQLAGLAMFGMLVILLAGLAVILYRLIVDTIEILAGVVVALLSTVTALTPWLVGGGVLVALAVVALRALPEAIEEAVVIRQHYIASRQPLLLEEKDVGYPVVDALPVRVVTTIDTEQ